MDSMSKAAYAAVEVVIWQLVASGTLPAEPLAAELDRYAGFSGEAGPLLRTLSCVARAAARPELVASQQRRSSKRRRSAGDLGQD
jgi:hypothetical protein